ncbi:MAG: PilN domain-containing protein [Armatimonadetes bacterium]|nr:PilN domain-containing protein [Armatimonadota bacterium]
MPSINMIAARRAEKRRQEQNIRKLIYGIATEVGVTVMVVSVMYVRLMGINGKISELNAEIINLQPTVTRIQQMETDTQQLQPKVTTLDGAKADTLFWYDNLYAITACLPPKTWLTTLGTAGTGGDGSPGTAGGGDPQMSLSGVALNQATVGTAILKMNQAPSLDHVDLASVTQQKTGQVNTVSFQMTVHLKPEAAPAGAAATGGAGNVQKS